MVEKIAAFLPDIKVVSRPALIYFSIVSVIAVLVVIYDKIADKFIGKFRVPLAVLVIIALLGGALFEYITMLTVRCNYRKKGFRTFLPLIAIIQLMIVAIYTFLKVRY